MPYEIKKNDRRPFFRVQLMQTDRLVPGSTALVPVDVTGATGVTFTMTPPLSTTPKFANIAGFIITAATGIVEYRWAAGDTDTSGVDWKIEAVVTWAVGETQTFPSQGYFLVSIFDDLA